MSSMDVHSAIESIPLGTVRFSKQAVLDDLAQSMENLRLVAGINPSNGTAQLDGSTEMAMAYGAYRTLEALECRIQNGNLREWEGKA